MVIQRISREWIPTSDTLLVMPTKKGQLHEVKIIGGRVRVKMQAVITPTPIVVIAGGVAKPEIGMQQIS
jgi:hypothetical protein